MEIPAKGQDGFLLRQVNPDTNEIEFFFRVYEGAAGNFKDYVIDISDLEIRILDHFASFYDAGDHGYSEPSLDYTSKTLGRKTNGRDD